MIILVRGLTDSHSQSYADRITAAMATTSTMVYGKKTLVLQATTYSPIENILRGKMLKAADIKSTEYSFEDSGMDAILRRLQMGHLDNEQFSDCCHAMSKQMNSLDIAGVSKDKEIASTLAENVAQLRELLRNANAIYDVVFFFLRGDDTELLTVLKENELYDREVVCITQGPCREKNADKNIVYAVKNYDRLSAFTTKVMSHAYNNRNIFPIPYNVMFKDACLSETALTFLSTNVNPDENDDNVYFSQCLSNLVGNLLGMAEPYVKERHFVYKKM